MADALFPAWTLPWHYLGATYCLIGGGQPQPASLRRRIEKNPALKADDQPAGKDAPPALVGAVLEIGRRQKQEQGGLRYNWREPWPEAVALRIRQGAGLRLGPRALVLPWPFPVGSGSESKPAHTAAPDEIALDAFMRAADRLAAGDGREAFLEALKRGDSATKLVREAAGEGVMPEGMDVQAHPWLPSMQTRLAWSGRHFTLHLGLDLKGSRHGASFFDTWPCACMDEPPEEDPPG